MLYAPRRIPDHPFWKWVRGQESPPALLDELANDARERVTTNTTDARLALAYLQNLGFRDDADWPAGRAPVVFVDADDQLVEV